MWTNSSESRCLRICPYCVDESAARKEPHYISDQREQENRGENEHCLAVQLRLENKDGHELSEDDYDPAALFGFRAVIRF